MQRLSDAWDAFSIAVFVGICVLVAALVPAVLLGAVLGAWAGYLCFVGVILLASWYGLHERRKKRSYTVETTQQRQEYLAGKAREYARQTPAERIERQLQDAELRCRYGSLPGD